MLALLVHGGAVTESWWRRTLSARSLGWVLVVFVALSVFGSVMTTCPRRARVPVAALAGVANAWLWLHVVDAVLHRRRAPRAFPVAPVGIVGVLVLVVGGTTAGFALAKTPVLHFVSPAEAATQWNPSATPADGTPLVVVTGFNTKWDGRADQYVRVDLPQWRFSYRGTTGGAPMPYTADDTHRALPDLVRALRDQVSTYHRDTGRRLTLVAESEGALLAKAYLAASPGAPVENLVILSPLVAPGRVDYPAAGDEGCGRGRCRRHGGVRVGARWRVAGRRHAGHSVSPLDRRRRAGARAADGVLASARPPTRGAAPRHRGRARPRRTGWASRTPWCPRSTAGCSTTTPPRRWWRGRRGQAGRPSTTGGRSPRT